MQQDLLAGAAQPGPQALGVAAVGVAQLAQPELAGVGLGALRRRERPGLGAGDGGEAGAEEHQVADLGQAVEQLARGGVVGGQEREELVGAAGALGGRIGRGHRTTVPRPAGPGHRWGGRPAQASRRRKATQATSEDDGDLAGEHREAGPRVEQLRVERHRRGDPRAGVAGHQLADPLAPGAGQQEHHVADDEDQRRGRPTARRRCAGSAARRRRRTARARPCRGRCRTSPAGRRRR